MYDLIIIYNGCQPINYSNYTPKDYIDASIDCIKYADEAFMKKIMIDGLEKDKTID